MKYVKEFNCEYLYKGEKNTKNPKIAKTKSFGEDVACTYSVIDFIGVRFSIESI